MAAMKALTTAASVPSLIKARLSNPISTPSFPHRKPKFDWKFTKSNFTKFTAISPSVSSSPPEAETETLDEDEKFDWFSEWYALMPVCDLDKRAPHGKKVMGLDVVIWWDKKDNAWKVFDDKCPHRLAPLSEGRIDQWGRLQCVYHGWCFDGSGDCKLIPQAPPNGPPVHSFNKACVVVYPSTVQNGIVWFWPNSDPKYKDILTKKKPPYIPELDDSSFTFQLFNRDMPYGYEILIENLMDPAHLPYAHYGIIRPPQPSVKLDREGGGPLEMNARKIDKNGFTTTEPNVKWNFISPCLIVCTRGTQDNTQGKLAQKPTQKELWIFICVPVSPGNSRLISIFPRNFDVWRERVFPRWRQHIVQNLIIDSDLYLLHVQEKKLIEAGQSNWQKVCFVPTKADANVVAYRKWLNKYAGGQIYWDGPLPPTPPREQLMDRYWSHVVNCSSCNGMYKRLNAVKVFLEVGSVVFMVAATKQWVSAKNALAVAAILCFVGSKWLSHFIYKNYHFHDYSHAYK